MVHSGAYDHRCENRFEDFPARHRHHQVLAVVVLMWFSVPGGMAEFGG
jgi:hypothetical protein